LHVNHGIFLIGDFGRYAEGEYGTFRYSNKGVLPAILVIINPLVVWSTEPKSLSGDNLMCKECEI